VGTALIVVGMMFGTRTFYVASERSHDIVFAQAGSNQQAP